MRNLLLFGSFGAGEVILITLIVLLLFGGKKIPELMKGIGYVGQTESRKINN